MVKTEELNKGRHNRTLHVQAEKSTLWDIPATEIPCHPLKDIQCLYEKAAAAAPQNPESTAAYCNVLDDRLRSECYFYAADQLNAAPATLNSQLDLCLAAQPFGERCLSHLLDQIVDALPPSHRLTEEAIQSLNRYHSFFSTADAQWKQDFGQQLSSTASLFILEHSSTHCAMPLHALSDDFERYWQSTIIFLQYPKQDTPQTQAERLKQAELWFTTDCEGAGNIQADPQQEDFHWEIDTEHAHSAFDRSPYLRSTFRAYSKDHHTDVELMWLEAAAQHEDWARVKSFSDSEIAVVQVRAKQLLYRFKR